MSSGNILELGIGFLQQFFALIQDRPDFSVPGSWDTANQYFRSLNFGMDFVRRYIPDLSDFRMYFLTASVIFPLFFTYLGLIFVNPLRVILWYFLVMMGTLLILVGASARIVNQVAASTDVQIQLDETAANIILIVGCSIVFICLVMYGSRNKLLTLCDEVAAKSANNTHMSVEEKMEDETKDISWNATISRLVTTCILVTLGASFVGVIDQGPKLPIQALARGLGWFFIGCAVPVFIYMILGLFEWGRIKQWKLAHFAEQHFLRLYLLILSLIYIPVGSGVLLVFNCNDFACPSGTRLFDEGSLAPFNKTGITDICVKCEMSYENSFCPVEIKNSMCSGAPESRLETDQNIRCDDITPFFWPAGIIVVIFFMLGVPYLFYKLILASTTILEEKFPESVKETGNSAKTEFNICSWEQSVLLSNSASRFLYQPFKSDMRYTRLWLLVQKLLIVFTAVFVIRAPLVNPTAIAIFCAVVIHFVVFLCFAYWAPFWRRFENGIAILMQVALTVAAVLSVLIYYEVDMPNWVYITIIVLNFVIPCMALVIGIILEWSGKQEEEEAENQKTQEEIEEAMNKEKEEEEKKEQERQQQLAAQKAAEEAQKAREAEAAVVAQQIAEIAHALEEHERMESEMGTIDQVQPSTIAATSVTEKHATSDNLEMHESQTSPPASTADEGLLTVHPDDENQQQNYSPQNNADNINPLSSSAATQHHQQQQDGEYDEYNNSSRNLKKSGRGRSNKSFRRVAKEGDHSAGYYDEDGFWVYDDETPEERRERRLARMRKRRQEIAARLHQKKAIHKEMVEKQRNTVDYEVDTVVKGHLNQTVMIGGIAYIIALCFCIVGLLTPSSTALTTFGDNSRSGEVSYELVGYDSWQNFTRECCCTSMQQGNLIVEKWVCSSNKIKERVRSQDYALPPELVTENASSVAYNGFAIRDICSPVFNSGCKPIESSDGKRIAVFCSDSVPDVTGIALGELW